MDTRLTRDLRSVGGVDGEKEVQETFCLCAIRRNFGGRQRR
jgi:hypothetical protein